MKRHYDLSTKRAVVAAFEAARTYKEEVCADSIAPIVVARAIAPRVSTSQVYEWLKQDLSDDAFNERKRRGGRAPALNHDQKALLIGYAISRRTSLEPVSLDTMIDFCDRYFSQKISKSTASRILHEFGFSSQKAMQRSSRMTGEAVVDDAIETIREIRSYRFPPHRVIAMDETGLWSNVRTPKTFHFKNWCRNSVCPFDLAQCLRSNAVVVNSGDAYRDTLVLTMRGDGVDIPPYFIKHTYKNAAKGSGRHCPKDEQPKKGMTASDMKKYVDHLSQYIEEPSLLLMDRLSSHTASEVIAYIKSKQTQDGKQLLFPILLGPKTAFLISPLDMGAIAAFKAHYYKLDRSTLALKKDAFKTAWMAVSNAALENIALNCGIVGKEDLRLLRKRFMKEVKGEVPVQLKKLRDYFDSWKSGAIEVQGAIRGRDDPLERPQQLSKADLDGKYWTNYRSRMVR